MLTIRKKISRYFNSAHKVLLFLLSTALSLPLAFVLSIAWFTVSDRNYSLKSLAYAEPLAFFLLIGIIWFITKRFLINVDSLISHVSRERIPSIIVTLVILITAASIAWMSLGSIIFNPPQSKHEIDVLPLNHSSGEICILEIVNAEGIKINKENNNIYEVLSTGAWVSRKNDCQFFLPRSSTGTLKFNYIGPLDDELTFLLERNKEAGELLISTNGSNAVSINLFNEHDAQTLRVLSLNHGIRWITWNIIGAAGLTAVILVLLMIIWISPCSLFLTIRQNITKYLEGNIDQVINIFYKGKTLPKINENRWIAAISIIALIFYAFFIERTSFSIGDEKYYTLIEDAMISMRYAKNFSQGFGLVWNIGQKPVQGFTNLGWTLIMAFIHLFPIPPSKISLVVMILSSLILVLNAFIIYKICVKLYPNSSFAPLATFTVSLFYYPLVFWSLRGMEVGFASLIVYFSVYCSINLSRDTENKKYQVLLAIGIFLSILIRIDLFLQVGLIMLYVISNKGILKKPRNILLPCLMFFIGTAGLFLFQFLYYGSVLPNTYYLKVIGVPLIEKVSLGLKVFVKYASRDFMMLLFISIMGFILFPDFRKKDYLFLLSLFIIQCFYSIYVGGDYAEPISTPQVDAANRFITLGMPSIILLGCIIIDKVINNILYAKDNSGKRKKNRVALWFLGTSISIILIISGAPWFDWFTNKHVLLNADIWRARVGVHIAKYTDTKAVIAVHGAGQVPYYSNRTTIDLLGKSDPVIATGAPSTTFRPGHNKWNYDYSIKTLQPDLIADNWGEIENYLANNNTYEKIDGFYLRKDSTLINYAGIKTSIN